MSRYSPVVAIKPSQNCFHCWKGFYYDTLALLSLTLLVGGSFAARPAQAQNLVSNPGFETGSFAGWTTDQSSTSAEVKIGSGFAHSGGYKVLFTGPAIGPHGLDATLSQYISTSVGDNYIISFWLANSQFSLVDEFHADFGSQTLLELQEVHQSYYTQDSYTTTATTASTTLTFAGRTPPSYFDLDDISVTDLGSPVPEASSILSFSLLLALGLGGVGVAARKKQSG